MSVLGAGRLAAGSGGGSPGSPRGPGSTSRRQGSPAAAGGGW